MEPEEMKTATPVTGADAVPPVSEALKDEAPDHITGSETQNGGSGAETWKAAEDLSSPGADESADAHESADARRTLVQSAIDREEAERAADQEDLHRYIAAGEPWREMSVEFEAALLDGVQQCQALLNALPELPDSIPTAMAEKLRGRRESLQLIGRMLDRTIERIDTIQDRGVAEMMLPEASTYDQWMECLTSGQGEADIARRLRQIGDGRYQVIVAARSLAEGREKRIFSFVERQILPILDALFDGETYSAPILADLKAQDAGVAAFAEGFAATYSELRSPILAALGGLKIRVMPVCRGDEIDYDRHEPIDSEPDREMDDEQIISVSRNGYERLVAPETWRMLRAAQVIVAKN